MATSNSTRGARTRVHPRPRKGSPTPASATIRLDHILERCSDALEVVRVISRTLHACQEAIEASLSALDRIDDDMDETIRRLPTSSGDLQ